MQTYLALVISEPKDKCKCINLQFDGSYTWDRLQLRHRCRLAFFLDFFNLQLYYKQDSTTGVFLWILRTCNFIKNETLAQGFSCNSFTKFLRALILQNICEVLFLIIRPLPNCFLRVTVQLLFMINCVLKMSMYLFNVFNE